MILGDTPHGSNGSSSNRHITSQQSRLQRTRLSLLRGSKTGALGDVETMENGAVCQRCLF